MLDAPLKWIVIRYSQSVEPFERITLIAALLTTLAGYGTAGAQSASDALTCGNAEVVAFALWKPWRLVGKPAERSAPRGTVLASPVTTSDGVILRGIVVPASKSNPRRKVLLVLYGNVTYSDTFYQMLKPLAIFDSEYDIVIYDYRGYWRSDGVPRYRALVNDVGEILRFLEGRYDEIRIYGASLGALIATRSAAEDDKIKGIFLDGVTSRLSGLSKDCASGLLDPVDMSESICKKVTLLLGGNDTLFPPELAKDFMNRMEACGNSRFVIDHALGHAYSESGSDRDKAEEERGSIIRRWLSEP